MPSKHARLSASAANRWMHCPGSVKLSDLFPQGSTEYADEGTIAHSMAEHMIGGTKTMKELVEDVRKAQDFYEKSSLDGNATEMEHYISTYAEYVSEQYAAEKHIDPASQLYTEMQVSMEDYIPGGFGTSDVVIIRDGFLHVIDLKYGKGVEVSVEGNPQIRLYALGAINMFDLMYEFKSVNMVIYQPRRESISQESMSVKDLQEWAEEVIKPAAGLALSDKPPYCPGEWCTSHFCPGAGACKARAKYVLELERHSGKDPALLSDAEIADCIGRAEDLAKWAKALGAYALDSALNGHAIPGYKVVEGRANRIYKDSDAVAKAVVGAGFDEAMIYKRELIGITDMEKLLTKKKFNEILKDLVIKPQGAPKLVLETDKRAEFKPNIKNEFEED